MQPQHGMICGALILAAGASTRFGSPKQLARIQGETLLERTIRVATETGCSPIIVVLGAHAKEITAACPLPHVTTVLSKDWQQGMGSSLAVGIPLLTGTTGTIVMTCDMPAVTATHLRALSATGEITGSAYAGRVGVPAYFPATSYSALLAFRGDFGARGLLISARKVVLPGGELDIDAPADFERALAFLAGTG